MSMGENEQADIFHIISEEPLPSPQTFLYSYCMIWYCVVVDKAHSILQRRVVHLVEDDLAGLVVGS